MHFMRNNEAKGAAADDTKQIDESRAQERA